MSETTAEIVARLARPPASVSEATIQSDVRALILAGRLNLTEQDVADPVSLEAQVGEGTRKRIDVDLSGCKTFQAKRKAIRAAVGEHGLGERLEELALRILPVVDA